MGFEVEKSIRACIISPKRTFLQAYTPIACSCDQNSKLSYCWQSRNDCQNYDESFEDVLTKNAGSIPPIAVFLGIRLSRSSR